MIFNIRPGSQNRINEIEFSKNVTFFFFFSIKNGFFFFFSPSVHKKKGKNLQWFRSGLLLKVNVENIQQYVFMASLSMPASNIQLMGSPMYSLEVIIIEQTAKRKAVAL